VKDFDNEEHDDNDSDDDDEDTMDTSETRKMVSQQNKKKKKSGGFQSMGKVIIMLGLCYICVYANLDGLPVYTMTV